MLFSPYCREFNSLQKRYTALFHRTNTFSENKIKRSVIGGKVDDQILSGTRSEKPKILFGTKLQFPKILFDTKLQFPKILFGSQRVRVSLVVMSLPPTVENFDTLTPVTVDDVKTTITSAPSKSCDLDPLPTDVLKEFLPELLPFLIEMSNKSLSRCVPQSQRHAFVTPRLKKANADPSGIKNYRSISNLTFISKVVERLVCRQLV